MKNFIIVLSIIFLVFPTIVSAELLTFDILAYGEKTGGALKIQWGNGKIESWCEGNITDKSLPFLAGFNFDGHLLNKEIALVDVEAYIKSMKLGDKKYEIDYTTEKGKTIIKRPSGINFTVMEEVKIMAMENILLMLVLNNGQIPDGQLFWREKTRTKRMIVEKNGNRKFLIYQEHAYTGEKKLMFKFSVDKEGYPQKLETNSGRWGLRLKK
jgi:hypothetical protein